MNRYLKPFTEIINYVYPKHNNNPCDELIFFDFETTGLNPYHNKIIEYAFIFEDNEVYNINSPSDYEDNNFISELVNPETKFVKKITDITGIHPDSLSDKPNINHFLPYIEEFINDKDINTTSYLVAHNCDSFDKLFLINNFSKYNEQKDDKLKYKDWKYIDTLHLAKKLAPNLKSYSLKFLCEFFNIEFGKHRAISDTICLRDVFHQLLNILSNKLMLSQSYLINNPKIVYDYIY